MTLQQQMKAKLESLGLPFTEIQCYGNQVTVECLSQKACEDFGSIIKHFATIRMIIKSYRYTLTNRKKSVNPPTQDVWRLYAKI